MNSISRSIGTSSSSLKGESYMRVRVLLPESLRGLGRRLARILLKSSGSGDRYSRRAQRSVQPPLIIRSGADLRVLSRPGAASRWTAVVLHVPGLPAEQSSRMESKLNRYLKECGCSLGAKCAVLALVGLGIWQFVQSPWSVWQRPGFLLRTFSAVLVVGVLGKLLGIAWAKAGTRRIGNQLSHFGERSSTEGRDHFNQ